MVRDIPTLNNNELKNTGQTRLIQSDSSARFSFELSGNLNKNIICNSKFICNFELGITLV